MLLLSLDFSSYLIILSIKQVGTASYLQYLKAGEQDMRDPAKRVRINSCDVLVKAPLDGRAGIKRPTRTYLQQLCMDTGCCLEDLPNATYERDEW